MPLYGRPVPYTDGSGPNQIGVYELWWSDNVVYIGSGVIRDRLADHARNPEMNWQRYKCNITNDKRRAEQIERREQRQFEASHGRPPRYNERIG